MISAPPVPKPVMTWTILTPNPRNRTGLPATFALHRLLSSPSTPAPDERGRATVAFRAANEHHPLPKRVEPDRQTLSQTPNPEPGSPPFHSLAAGHQSRLCCRRPVRDIHARLLPSAH